MKNLYEIHEIEDYGRSIATHGTVFANDKDEARKLAAIHHNNKEIYTTGFYEARLVVPVATINPDESEEHRKRKLEWAKSDVKRFSKKIKL